MGGISKVVYLYVSTSTVDDGLFSSFSLMEDHANGECNVAFISKQSEMFKSFVNLSLTA